MIRWHTNFCIGVQYAFWGLRMLRAGVFGAAISAVVLFGASANAGETTSNWTGLYVGGHAGYAWGDWDGTLATTSGPLLISNPDRTISDDGFLGGLQAGYNLQSNGVVFGIEGDISWADIDATGTVNTDSGGPAVWSKKHDLSLDYLGTLRARIGVPFGHVLPYVTGGLAWGKTEGNLAVAYYQNPANPPYGISGASADENHFGWTVGGGVEVALGGNWSLKAEYQHIDLGEEQYAFKGAIFNIANPNNNAAAGSPFDTDSFRSDLKLDTVKIGLNYKFGGQEDVVPLK
jgi:opacity protein-like surface antigen